jgi:hypothetical protein
MTCWSFRHAAGLLASALCAAGAAAATPAALAPEPLRFAFQVLEGQSAGGLAGAALVELGRLSAHAARGRSPGIVVTRRVAVRLEGVASSARVSVALLAETPGSTVRLDGVVLSTLPRLIDPVHRVGSTVVHQLEITVPPGVAAGPFLSNLQWLADTD